MLFGLSKIVFHFLAQNWQEISKKLTVTFADFFGFVHSMTKKKHKKVSKSSNADKNGLREYQIKNFRHFLLNRNQF